MTGERLDDKFTRVGGMNFKTARRNADDIWGGRIAAQYESEWQAGVSERRLVEVEQLGIKDWARNMTADI